MHERPPYYFAPLLSAGILLGAGMGGFVDGIVLHQILQVHNMLSAQMPVDDLISAKANMVWDGFFHAGVWMLSAIGLFALFRAGRRRDVPWNGSAFFGSWLMGWGLFNLVEGTVNHHLLGLHHVLEYADRPTQALADTLFLVAGALMTLAGWVIVRLAKNAWEQSPRAQLGAGSLP